MRYRASETNYQYGYRHICLYGCLLTANKVGGAGEGESSGGKGVGVRVVFLHKFLLVQLTDTCC